MKFEPAKTKPRDSGHGRLKAPGNDPLESIGLPSKGETRLSHFESQEEYYDSVLDRCLLLSSFGRSTDTMGSAFEQMKLSETEDRTPETSDSRRFHKKESEILFALRNERQLPSQALTIVLQAIRKLREAVVATGRHDAFACNVFLFGMRIAILFNLRESYLPAMLHLLHRMPRKSFPTRESVSHVRNYYILDLACRQDNLSAAYGMIFEAKIRGSNIHRLVAAISNVNWIRFERIFASLDLFEKRLAENVCINLRTLAVRCLGRTYLQIEEAYFEQVFHLSWTEVQREQNLTWPVADGKVLIKQAKRH